jgi:hypothetical protein
MPRACTGHRYRAPRRDQPLDPRPGPTQNPAIRVASEPNPGSRVSIRQRLRVVRVTPVVFWIVWSVDGPEATRADDQPAVNDLQQRGRGQSNALYLIFARRCVSLVAEVAELADALASGASGRKPIGVQIPASAPALRLLISSLRRQDPSDLRRGARRRSGSRIGRTLSPSVLICDSIWPIN